VRFLVFSTTSLCPKLTISGQKKIVAAFPEGWMSTGQISRDGTLLPQTFLSWFINALRCGCSELYEEENGERSYGTRSLILSLSWSPLGFSVSTFIASLQNRLQIIGHLSFLNILFLLLSHLCLCCAGRPFFRYIIVILLYAFVFCLGIILCRAGARRMSGQGFIFTGFLTYFHFQPTLGAPEPEKVHFCTSCDGIVITILPRDQRIAHSKFFRSLCPTTKSPKVRFSSSLLMLERSEKPHLYLELSGLPVPTSARFLKSDGAENCYHH
jgi:hypothetical protein